MSEWQRVASAPMADAMVWVWNERQPFLPPTLKAADGSWWRQALKDGLSTTPTHWRRVVVPVPPVGANLRVETPEQKRRPDDRHYDTEGYCDNPGRGY
jgi:hypothetical protein